jgi:pimeloyl-ACP methyl ester carboxylesterase
MAHRFRLVERFDVTERLRYIRVPTLVLTGDRDLLVSEESLTALCAGLEDCRQVTLPGSGHLACVTQPGRVAEEVQRFRQRAAAPAEVL